MSSKIMGAVWDLKLPHSQQSILLALGDHADHTGNNVYPSLGLVAWKTGYSIRQVRRIVNKLLELKLLILVEDRPGTSKKYKINLSVGKLKSNYRPTSEDTPDILSDQVGHNSVRSTPDIAVSDKPSLEPSEKKESDALEIARLKAENEILRNQLEKQSNAKKSAPPSSKESSLDKKASLPRAPQPCDGLMNAIGAGSFGITGELNGTGSRIGGIVFGDKREPKGLFEIVFQTKDVKSIEQVRIDKMVESLTKAYKAHSLKLDTNGQPLAAPTSAPTINNMLRTYLKSPEAEADKPQNLDDSGMDLNLFYKDPYTGLYKRRA